ncbi:MAG: DUF6326 family protein [Bacteroidota bacterium]
MTKQVSPQALLSSLWIFILFNMTFRDFHQFLAPGYIEEMMAMEVANLSLLFYGIILEIPIAMVVLARILPDGANRWANLGAASIFLLGLLSNLNWSDYDDVFFATANVLACGAIIRTVLRLPFPDQEGFQRARSR